jgi:hypothetical protein
LGPKIMIRFRPSDMGSASSSFRQREDPRAHSIPERESHNQGDCSFQH